MRYIILMAAALTGSPAFAAAPALKSVVLSSGGVGQFVYDASTDGQTPVQLTVPLAQVDDVLKSLRIHDPAGAPAAVRLPGKQPLAEIFRTLPFSGDDLASTPALLGALAGAEVKVNGIDGTILSVDSFTVAGKGDATVERHHLNIATATGIDSVVLEDMPKVEITAETLRRQIATALAALRANRAQDQREITIDLAAGGARDVTLETVVPVPVWKATYRASLPAGGDGTAMLNGWAVVENLSGQAWHDVDVTLTSGQPVLYHQALYDAIFAQRPEAPVDIASRITPRLDAGQVAGEGDGGVRAGAYAAAPAPAPPMMRGAAAPRLPQAAQQAAAKTTDQPDATETEQAATQVLFHLTAKVNAEPGQTLMLPIIAQALPAKRIALYQRQTDPVHPLVAMRLENNTGAALPPGLMTLYDQGNGTFIGDARLPTIAVGEQRLASFAVDLPVHVDAEDKPEQTVTGATISGGVLHRQIRARRVTTYRVRTPADGGRTFMVEVPREEGWTLAEPTPGTATMTPTDWRVTRDLPAGQLTVFQLVLEQPVVEDIVLGTAGAQALLALASSGDLPAAVKPLVQKAADLAAAADRQKVALTGFRQREQAIVNDQDRVRKNLQAVPANSDLARGYLATLQSQEKALATLRDQEAQAQQALEAAQGAFADYVAGLSF